MRILVIGATGMIGRIAADALVERGHDVLRASRTSEPSVDLTDPGSIAALFKHVGKLDSVIVAAGATPFKPLADLNLDDYSAALNSKVLGQIEVARQAIMHLADRGSITLTSGVLARSAIRIGAAASTANGALEAFVLAAGAEAPRGIRINAVSPDVLASSENYHSMFPGHRPVTDSEIANAYVRAVEGVATGQTFAV